MYKVYLLILISILIILIMSTSKINNSYSGKLALYNSIIDINKNNTKDILYDGKKLIYPAQKKISFLTKYNNNDIKVNCNSNIIECKVDTDCNKRCLNLNNHKIICSNGLCRYFPKESKIICENGGQIASYFMYGRLYTACICPKNFIGLSCQIPNQMNSSDLRTFDLEY